MLKKIKIAILGAGISGLSIAKLLKDNFDVEIFERLENPGGIARSKIIDKLSYHVTGGHCFNSNYPEVMDFVFNDILPITEWNKIERKAEVILDDFTVPYPIEYAIKHIFKYKASLAQEILSDYFSTKEDMESTNLFEWFEQHFGKVLTKLYFKPYNEKIWKKNLEDVSCEWVKDKLPIPDKASVLRSLFEDESDQMPHRFFYYPKSNSQNTFIDRLAEGLKINFNYNITKISHNDFSEKWTINDKLEFDLVISTLPLNELPLLIKDTPEKIIKRANQLNYNKLTTTLWKTQPTKNTWTYVPDKKKLAHRYIHIGNFFNPNKNVTITEAIGGYTLEEIVQNEAKNPFFIKPLAHHVSNHAYVVFDKNHKSATREIFDYLNHINLYSLGRFGEWQYYNMDVCIKKSIDLSKIIIDKYGNSNRD